MIDRSIAASVLGAARDFPVVVITGPRQSGKTTLARQVFPNHRYVLLEDPDQRRLAESDPRRFLGELSEGAILDEVQRAPELFSYLLGMVDDDPCPGRFVLTGSQQFGLLSRITQSLAGRAAMLVLLPFSHQELSTTAAATMSLEEVLWRGFYPPVHDRNLEPGRWYANYVATYVERDVRQLVNVRDLRAFDTFLRLCAARCGQLVNLSALAADCGITHNTAKGWLSVLEASYIVHPLPRHFSNFSKQLVKAPKLHFLDVGLAAWLLDIQSPQQLATHPMRGALFESWVCAELLKGVYNRGERPRLYFWRDRGGLEIDFLVDQGTRLVPIEAKSGETFVMEWLRPLRKWSALAGEAAARGWLVHGGDIEGPHQDYEAVSWRHIDRLCGALAHDSAAPPRPAHSGEPT